jgi:hypothetical protein
MSTLQLDAASWLTSGVAHDSWKETVAVVGTVVPPKMPAPMVTVCFPSERGASKPWAWVESQDKAARKHGSKVLPARFHSKVSALLQVIASSFANLSLAHHRDLKRCFGFNHGPLISTTRGSRMSNNVFLLMTYPMAGGKQA